MLFGAWGLIKNVHFFAVDADAVDGFLWAKAGEGVVADSASGDAGGDYGGVEDKLVVNMERGVGGVAIADGVPTAVIFFHFVSIVVGDGEIKGKGDFEEGDTGSDEFAVGVECHKIEDGEVGAEGDAVGFPEEIVGRGTVIKCKVAVAVFWEVDVAVGVGADMSLAVADETVEENARRDMAGGVGAGDLSMLEEARTENWRIAGFVDGYVAPVRFGLIQTE